MCGTHGSETPFHTTKFWKTRGIILRSWGETTEFKAPQSPLIRKASMIYKWFTKRYLLQNFLHFGNDFAFLNTGQVINSNKFIKIIFKYAYYRYWSGRSFWSRTHEIFKVMLVTEFIFIQYTLESFFTGT